MPTTICNSCGGSYAWRWEEAFDKFGFGDGDGQIMTDHVVEALHTAGYEALTAHWGLHNVMIYSVKQKGVEQIPEHARVGYCNPREYLPEAIVRVLDANLSADAELAL